MSSFISRKELNDAQEKLFELIVTENSYKEFEDILLRNKDLLARQHPVVDDQGMKITSQVRYL